jgi:hypothetical protein
MARFHPGKARQKIRPDQRSERGQAVRKRARAKNAQNRFLYCLLPMPSPAPLDQFLPLRLSARSVIAATRGNGRDAPKPALRLSWVERVKPTRCGSSSRSTRTAGGAPFRTLPHANPYGSVGWIPALSKRGRGSQKTAVRRHYVAAASPPIIAETAKARNSPPPAQPALPPDTRA